MFYKLRKTLVAAALLPLAFGCKRENPNQLSTSPITAAPETSKVQQWLKGNPKALAGLKMARKAGTTLPDFTLQWQDAGFDAASHTHWVPATPANEKRTVSKPSTYLVATENGQGQITDGQYIMVLPNAKKMGASAANGFNHALLAARPNVTPAGFSGALLYYDVAGQLTDSKVYEGGQLQPNATANLAARKTAKAAAKGEAEEDPSPNTVINNCDGLENECIEWYLQTYVNGELVEEEYQFTTCCNTNGGGNNSNANCQAQLDAMVAEGQVVTNGPITETTVSQTNLEWAKTYKWLVFTAGFWKLYSFDKIHWKRVYYPSSNQTMWEYKSAEHIKMDHEGTTAGGERTYSDNGATYNNTLYTVYVHLDFGVTNKACGITRSDLYNGETKIVAPNRIQYVNGLAE
jgi:hypothetical protein